MRSGVVESCGFFVKSVLECGQYVRSVTVGKILAHHASSWHDQMIIDRRYDFAGELFAKAVEDNFLREEIYEHSELIWIT